MGPAVFALEDPEQRKAVDGIVTPHAHYNAGRNAGLPEETPIGEPGVSIDPEPLVAHVAGEIGRGLQCAVVREV